MNNPATAVRLEQTHPAPGRRRRTNRPTELQGPEGLVIAIVAQAAHDLHDKRQRADALRYFAGPEYAHHLGLLGLPPDWLPQELTR